jgi:hypothetical protein
MPDHVEVDLMAPVIIAGKLAQAYLIEKVGPRQ